MDGYNSIDGHEVNTTTEKGVGMSIIRVVGVSGVGKTSVMEQMFRLVPNGKFLNYGSILKSYGYAADRYVEKNIVEHDFVMIDDHLEIGSNDLTDIYRREKTSAILLLTASPEDIISRRAYDLSRSRPMDMSLAHSEQVKVIERARRLAVTLSIPLVEFSCGTPYYIARQTCQFLGLGMA